MSCDVSDASQILKVKEEETDADDNVMELNEEGSYFHETFHMDADVKEEPINFVECDVEIKQETVSNVKKETNSTESLDDRSSTRCPEDLPEGKNLSPEKRFKCNECNFRTAYKSVITVHCRVHTGDRPFRCNECNFGFAHSSALKVHKRIHTGERPFRCSECGFSTARKAALAIHKRTHTGVKPYACDQCDFTTSQCTNLRVHKRKHTGEKPYECNQCPYKAGDITSYKRHQMGHSGLKPYKCDMCTYCTKRKEYLLNHLKRHSV